MGNDSQPGTRKHITSDKAHDAIMRDFTLNKNSDRSFGYGKARRIVSIQRSGSIRMPKWMEEKVSSSGVMLYPEFAEYAFQVEGVAKKLLLFIIFHLVNPRKNTFLFNAHVIAGFNRYSTAIAGITYTMGTVKQALRKELVARNLVANVSKGKYMLNPMIGGCSTMLLRKTLIAEYSSLLVNKGKDPIAGFYPKY